MISAILWISVAAWAVAQILGLAISSAQSGQFAWRYLSMGGGMPSSHSAMVCACATAVGWSEGVGHPLFALAAVVAFIVMYDACNVRWETGKQAKLLNRMMERWPEDWPLEDRKPMKETLGHSKFQVAMGALLGIAVGVAGSLIAF